MSLPRARSRTQTLDGLGQYAVETEGGEEMDEDAETAHAADPDSTWLHRVGGISALVLGVAYISIIPLCS
jgi:hypothetical protein